MKKTKNWTNLRITGLAVFLIAFCVVAVLAGRATYALAKGESEVHPRGGEPQESGEGEEITSPLTDSLSDCLELNEIQYVLIGRQQVMIEILR